jgi:hypothetical protein
MDIDDLLKKSFEQSSVVYKDAYWQDASSKIDQHYKRKFYIQISITALILILVVLLSYVFYSSNSQNLNWFKDRNTSLKTGIIASKKIDNNAVSISSSQGKIEPINPLIEGQSTSRSDDILNSQQNYSKLSLTDLSQIENTSESHDDNMTKVAQGKFIDSNKISKTVANKQDVRLDLGYSELALQVEGSSVLSDQKVDAQEMNNSFNDNSQSLDAEFKPFMNLASLVLPFNLIMEQQAIQFDIISFDNPIADIKPVQNKSYLEYGLMAEISTFPKFSSDNKNIVGGIGGLDLRYYFNEHFLMRSGIQVGYRGGSFSPSVYSTQKSYFLGPEEDAYVFRPTGLVTMTLPFQFGYNFDKFMIAFGINAHYLAATYGNLEYAESDFRSNAKEKPFEVYTPVQSGWMSNAGLHRFIYSYQVSVNRNIYKRLSAGVNLQYLPADWTADNYGQIYSFEAGQYINPAFENRGLIEKNWIVNFNIYYRL